MQWDGVLVRFGEIGIKSPPVRRRMLEHLRQNLVDGLVREGLEGDVQRLGPRLWVVGPDVSALTRLATRTFGVVSASPCRLVSSDMETLCATGAAMALARDSWKSFAVRASRDGEHAYTSQDLGREVGSAIYVAMEGAGRPVRVDLGAPDLEIHIDVRQQRAWMFLERQVGPGGLPVGAQGKALVLLSDIPSAVAAWLLMRRGAAVRALHAGHTGSLPIGLAENLAAWGMPPEIDLLPVCSGATTKAALQEAACVVATEYGMRAIATGDRTHSKLASAPLPVLRPVAGMDEETLQGFVDRIGLAGLDEAEPLLDAAATEDVQSLLSMRRTVSV